MFFRTTKSKTRNRSRSGSHDRNVDFHVEALEYREMLTGIGDDVTPPEGDGSSPPPVSDDGG